MPRQDLHQEFCAVPNIARHRAVQWPISALLWCLMPLYCTKFAEMEQGNRPNSSLASAQWCSCMNERRWTVDYPVRRATFTPAVLRMLPSALFDTVNLNCDSVKWVFKLREKGSPYELEGLEEKSTLDCPCCSSYLPCPGQ